MKKTRSVDEYIANETIWQDELTILADLLRQTSLTETIKWGAPCYVAHGQNVVGMLAFKAYFGLWFHQGVFLSDPEGVLINAQPDKTKALRQWRMTSARDIQPAAIVRYVNEAITLAKAGKSMKPTKKASSLAIPPELKQALIDHNIKDQFTALTLGKRREYCDYIANAKQAKTIVARIQKIVPMIRNGVGLNDKYR